MREKVKEKERDTKREMFPFSIFLIDFEKRFLKDLDNFYSIFNKITIDIHAITS